jgi:hypothetical protein
LSSRVGFVVAVLLLLIAAGARLWQLDTLPPGISTGEVDNIRIAEAIRNGQIEVFYDLSEIGESGGREGFYHAVLAVSTGIMGQGLLTYRLVSVFISLITVALVYAIGMRLYGPLAGLCAMAVMTLGMLPIIIGRTIGPEALLPLVFSTILLALIHALPVYRPDREPATISYSVLGISLGIGFYVHPFSILFTGLALAFIIYMARRKNGLNLRTISYIGFALLVAAIIAIPYLSSTLQMPDLDGTHRLFNHISLNIQTLWRGVNGLFFIGDANPLYNLPGRPMFDLVSGVLMVFGLMMVVRNRRTPRYALLLFALIIIAPTALLAADAPSFIHYASLLPLLALLFGLGVRTLYTSLPRKTGWALALAMFVLLGFNIYWTYTDLFERWGDLPETQSAYQAHTAQVAHHLDLTAHQMPTLICIPTSVSPPNELTEIEVINLIMNRKNAPIRYADCGTGLILSNGGGLQQIILAEQGNLEKIHPYLRTWLEQGTFLAQEDIPPDTIIMLDVAQQLGHTIGNFINLMPVHYAPETGSSRDPVSLPVRFGGNITLVGYEAADPAPYPPGGVVTVISYWRVEGPLPRDMRLFTHILSDPADIIAQTDTRSVLPASLEPRDIFIQVTFITLPKSTPEGIYDISIGAYQDSDRMRMSVLADGKPNGTRLFLTHNQIRVAGD